MALDFPSTYQAAIGRPFKENWLVKVFNTSDPAGSPNNALMLSFGNTTVDDQHYEGAIEGSPSVRESIDLAAGSAGSDNITLTFSNFTYQGNPVSQELFGGSNKYINKPVYIYSQLNDESTLANCHLIFEGRISGISHSASKVTIKVVQHRPWDHIEIPTTKSDQDIYQPVVYGDYSINASASFADNKNLFPIPLNQATTGAYYYVSPRSLDGTSGNKGNPHYYESGADRFAQIGSGSASSVDENETSSIPVVSYPPKTLRSFLVRPIRINDNDQFTNSANAFDGNSGTSATHSFSGNGGSTKSLKVDLPKLEGSFTSVTLNMNVQARISAGGDPLDTVEVRNKMFGSTTTIITQTGSVNSNENTSYSENLTTKYQNNGNKMDDYIEIEGAISGNSGSFSGDIEIREIYLTITISLEDPNSTSSDKSDINEKAQDKIYLGCDGLSQTYTGGSGLAKRPHQIHRDLLKRFTGVDYSDTNMDGWSDLNTARSSWEMRVWILDPTDLKRILDRITFEGGFIFRFKPGSKGKYIHIKDTYASGDISATLSKSDTADLKVDHTSLPDLVTKRTINYQAHPAESKYLSTVVSENSTARTDWNIAALENHTKTDLDYYVGPDPDTDPTNNNPNDNFGAYYDNINGNIKVAVSGEIKNPAMYNLEAGDIVKFDNSNMVTSPFGKSWTNVAYMITGITRQVGHRKFTAVEVGTIS